MRCFTYSQTFKIQKNSTLKRTNNNKGMAALQQIKELRPYRGMESKRVFYTVSAFLVWFFASAKFITSGHSSIFSMQIYYAGDVLVEFLNWILFILWFLSALPFSLLISVSSRGKLNSFVEKISTRSSDAKGYEITVGASTQYLRNLCNIGKYETIYCANSPRRVE